MLRGIAMAQSVHIVGAGLKPALFAYHPRSSPPVIPTDARRRKMPMHNVNTAVFR
jgi:hypothetical protein